MKKCESYDKYVRERSATEFEKGVHFGRTGEMIEKVTEAVSRCKGTKECEPCKCGGDRRKCDFYPENRLLENVAKYEEEHAPKFGEWISVKDELPPRKEKVLVCDKDGSLGIDWQAETSRFVGRWFIHSNKSISHWMPLPEPPKESEA